MTKKKADKPEAAKPKKAKKAKDVKFTINGKEIKRAMGSVDHAYLVSQVGAEKNASVSFTGSGKNGLSAGKLPPLSRNDRC